MKENKNHRRPDPFPAPEGYFDNLTDRINSRIKDREKERTTRSIHMPAMAGWAAAAVVSLIAVFWLFDRPDTPEKTASELVAELSDEEIIEYLMTTDMSVEEIYSAAEFSDADADSLQLQVLPELDLAPDELDELIELYDLEELENS